MTALSLPPTRYHDPFGTDANARVTVFDARGARQGRAVLVSPRLVLTTRAVLPEASAARAEVALPGGGVVQTRIDPDALFVEAGEGLLVVALDTAVPGTGCDAFATLAGREVRLRVGDPVTVAGHSTNTVLDVDESVVRHLGRAPAAPGAPVVDARGLLVAVQHAPTIATLDDHHGVVGEALRVHGVFDRLQAVRHRLGAAARALVAEVLGPEREVVPVPREVTTRLDSQWVLPPLDGPSFAKRASVPRTEKAQSRHA